MDVIPDGFVMHSIDAVPAAPTDAWRTDPIDIEIRRLVWLMNQWPGLRTFSSCAGHGAEPNPGTTGFIWFTADSQHAVRAFIDILPNWGTHATFAVGCGALIHHVGITIQPTSLPDQDPTALVYQLSIAGTPLYHQRAQIEAIERALAAALATAGHPTLG